MKIVILNESYVSEERLDELRALGEVAIYENTHTEVDIVERLAGADVAIIDCFIAPFTRSVFEKLPQLKYISINSTGFDAIDVEAAKDHGVLVSNVPSISTESVAEMTIALLLAVSRHIPQVDAEVRRAGYDHDPVRENVVAHTGFDLKGKTIGILGLGDIGTRVSELAHAFGMKVIVKDPYAQPLPHTTFVDLPTLLRESDVISLHVPLNAHTEGMLGGAEFAQMKDGVVLINTARGKIVNEAALIQAIQSEKVSAAGMDVLVDWSHANPLLKMNNVVITPHTAWCTKESMENIGEMIFQNVSAFIKGAPINIVNK